MMISLKKTLMFVAVWFCSLTSCWVNLIFCSLIKTIGSQLVRFHKDVIAASGNPSSMAWLFQVMGISCVILCIGLTLFRKGIRWQIACVLYSYLTLLVGGIVLVELSEGWLKASMFL